MSGRELDDRPSIPDAVASVEGVEVDYDAVERIGPVGSGSNATVSEARVADRRVALKEPSVEDDRVAERFVREAETWERVADHDHVVSVFDWGTGDEADGTDAPWLALEFADGGDLRSRDRHGVAEALWNARCLTDAVAHTHEQGVAHLDLTPDNVLFRTVEDGWDVPKIGDWGLARRLDAAADGDGVTPPYAAPEQFDPDTFGDPDERTDVYGLGALLYHLLTGEAPYSGAPSEIEAAVLDDDSPRPTAVDPSLSARLDEIVARAMATNPEERYETAAALHEAVDDLLSMVEAESGETDGVKTVSVLESHGFERLTPGYFEGRDPAPPTETWRAGLGLVDVSAGYAVERRVERDGETVSLSGRLLDRLADGESVAVVGAPGAGKSTVCKQVACEWHELDHGPVVYRESGQGRRLDAPATLERYLRGVDGHALVVVEDAVRGEASAVFDAIGDLETASDVSVLLDARREEWQDADAVLDADRERVRRRAVDVEHLSPPDRGEYERFVAAVERSTGTDVDLSIEELLPDVRGTTPSEERQPGELFLLLHRLLSYVNGLETDDETVTTLEEAVRLTRLDLERRGETFLDVGVAANLLNAAGVGVYPELLHAAAPDDEAAVAEALEALGGRVVFPDEDAAGDGPYRAVHEVWSAEFLTNLLDAEGAADAHERFGRVLSRILALADDAELREDVAWILRGETEYLERIAEAPGEWADAVVEDAFEFGTEWPKLAPLFGTTDASAIDLPDACSEELLPRRALWRGDMYRRANEYDSAQEEYARVTDVLDRLDHASVDADLLRGRAAVGTGVIHYDRAEYERARERLRDALDIAREQGVRSLEATVLNELGSVAHREGEMDRARELYQRSLDLDRELGDRKGEADVLTGLGSVALFQQRYEQSHEYTENALEIYRELGDRQGKVDALFTLGSVAYERAHRDRHEYDTGIEYWERCLEIASEIGDRRSVARTLYSLGQAANSKGASDEAEEYLQRSLDATREIGDRDSEINSLIGLGNVSEGEQNFHEAQSYYETAFELSEEIGNPRSRAHSATGIGLVCVTVAEYDEAREYLSQGLDDARAIDDTRIEGFMLHYLGDVARLRGEFGHAHDYYRDALEIRREMGARRREAFSRNGLGRTARKQAQYDRACDHFEAVRDIASDMDATDLECQGLCGLGATARQRGDLGRARERLERALSLSEEIDEPILVGRIRLELGRLDLETDDPSAARDHAERSYTTVDDIGAIHWGARSRELQGLIAAETDDPAAAREHWRAALAVFEDVGAYQDALATLEHLVETCREAGDEAAACEWCERACETLADAPEEVADRHREWVDRHAAALDTG